MRKNFQTALFLILLFGIAGGIRLWGIDFGLPYIYHIDEPVYVSAALNLGSGVIGKQPTPTGLPTILFLEYGLYFVLGYGLKLFSSLAEFEQAYRADPTVFFLLARATSAIFGALTVILVYYLGSAVKNRKAGAVAAIILAVSFLPVRDSHYAVPDTLMIFFLVLLTLLCVYAVQKKSAKYFFAAAFAAGLAIATKWTVWILITIGVAVLLLAWENKRLGWRKLPRLVGLALVGGLAGFTLIGFQFFINPGVIIWSILREISMGGSGGFSLWQVDTVPGWVFYLKTILFTAGIGVFSLALFGFGMRVNQLIKEKDPGSILLLAFPVFYFVIMGSTRHYFARYTLPLMPFASIFAAEAIVVLGSLFSRQESRREWIWVALIVLAANLQPLVNSLRSDALIRREDTRTIAKQWIEANLPEGAKIGVDWLYHTPPLQYEGWPIPYSERSYVVSVPSFTGLFADQPASWYRENGYQYLVASSFLYQVPLLDAEKQLRREQFYAELGNQFSLVGEFYPNSQQVAPAFVFDEMYGPYASLWERQRPGPVIKIYAVEGSEP